MPSSTPAIACGLALAWCALLLFLHGALGSFHCAQDTSYCADSTEKRGYYSGTVVDKRERPVAQAEIWASFETRGLSEPVKFKGGADGSFCLVWSQEAIVPSFTSTDGTVVPEDNGVGQPKWTSFDEAEPPDGCSRSAESVPWYNAEDGLSTPVWRIPYVVGALAMLALLIGFFPDRRFFRWSGMVLTVLLMLSLAPAWAPGLMPWS